ncbi:MAG: hypothetical protein FD169_1502 [Bacillota bacterium]|nr:MAG: hypothetical protein FD169_1502 [Bacillota bacterium]
MITLGGDRMSDDKELLTAQVLAKALDFSVETIWRYTRENKIPYIELGSKQYRYRLTDVINSLSCSQIREKAVEYKADPTKKLTYEDYLKLPEEPGYSYEILDGLLVKDPSPTVLHQRVSRRLQRLLEDYFAISDPTGEIFDAPLDVTLGDYTVVHPDIFYIASRQEEIVLHARIDGPPTLVVEVISPSTSRKDRLRKLRIYQQAQVRHYWLVNPDEKTLECFALKDGAYTFAAGGMDDEVVEHPTFVGLSVDLKILW